MINKTYHLGYKLYRDYHNIYLILSMMKQTFYFLSKGKMIVLS